MTSHELRASLQALRLSPSEAAELLGVSERSLRRWGDNEGDEVPGPVEAALRAWIALDQRHLPWKPDTVSIFEGDKEQIQRMREHNLALHEVLKQVEARNGPTHVWSVDIPRARAVFGPHQVSFYRLGAGGFNVSTYHRKDAGPAQPEPADLEDAVHAIALAFARARRQNASLLALAEYLQTMSGSTAPDDQARIPPEAMAQHRSALAKIADELIQLAAGALDGAAQRAQYERLEEALHRLGVYPPINLISDIAQSFLGRIDPEPPAFEP
jgi:DNA-binding transcriptional MerR regulator